MTDPGADTTPTILVLHGEDGTLRLEDFVRRIGKRHSISVPTHPGWDRVLPGPELRTVDGLSYHYLDALDELPAPAHVIGFSLGAWLAAAIAVKSCARIRSLTLVSPVGIRLGGPQDRTFVDIYATRPPRSREVVYAPGSTLPALGELSDDAFLDLTYAQEATARVVWEPYFHDPHLLRRLHRIDVPTLVVSGAEDQFVLAEGYYARYAEAIGPDVRQEVIGGAGHRVEEEAAEQLADLVLEFWAGSDRRVPAEATDGGMS